MSLHRYEVEARGIADELLDLLTLKEQEQFAKRLADDDADLWFPPTAAQFRCAIDFASETPAKKATRWKRTKPEERLPLWALARVVALRSATTIRVAAEIELVIGMKYRQAVQHAALANIPDHLAPALDELLDPVL